MGPQPTGRSPCVSVPLLSPPVTGWCRARSRPRARRGTRAPRSKRRDGDEHGQPRRSAARGARPGAQRACVALKEQHGLVADPPRDDDSSPSSPSSRRAPRTVSFASSRADSRQSARARASRMQGAGQPAGSVPPRAPHLPFAASPSPSPTRPRHDASQRSSACRRHARASRAPASSRRTRT